MSSNYTLNTRFKDERSGEVFSYREHEGFIWRVFESGRPSVNVGRAGSRPVNSAAAASGKSAQQNTPQSGDTTGLANAIGNLQLGALPVSKAVASGKAVVLKQTDYKGGIKDVTTKDPQTGVETDYRIGPTLTYGSRQVLQKTIRGSRGTGGGASSGNNDSSSLVGINAKNTPKAKTAPPGYEFGQVIETTLVPLPGDHFSDITTATIKQQPVFPIGAQAAIRRFVVVEAASKTKREFTALSIKTYNGLGVAYTDNAGRSMTKAFHAVIYTAEPSIRPPAPYPTPDEQQLNHLPSGAVERPMQSVPILVVQDDLGRPLDPMSRLDYSDAWTFEPNTTIRLYGHVHEDYFHTLRWTHTAVRDGAMPTHVVPAPVPTPLHSGQPPMAPGSQGASYGGTVAPPVGSPPNVSRTSSVPPPQVQRRSNVQVPPAPSSAATRAPRTSSSDQQAVPQNPQTQQNPPPTQQSQQAAQQARNARAMMQREMQGGRSQAEALEVVVRQYVTGGYQRDRAIGVLRALMPEYAGIPLR